MLLSLLIGIAIPSVAVAQSEPKTSESKNPAPQSETPQGQLKGQYAAYYQLQQQDQRILDIGYRLARANARWCADGEFSIGVAFHYLGQYGQPDQARAAFGFAGGFAILALAQNGPAAKAGLAVNDSLLAINGKELRPKQDELERIEDHPESYKPLHWLKTQLRLALTSSLVELEILRDGQRQIIEINAEQICQSEFEVRPDGSKKASADGRLVQISSRMIAATNNDDQLAWIMAHELSHNILRHRKRLNSADINRGVLRVFGRNARLIRTTEEEADRLSVWLMANAGYDLGGATSFWQDYGPANDDWIFSSPTHYRWQKRLEIIEAEIADIQAATANAAAKADGDQTENTMAAGLPPPLLQQALPILD